MKIIHKSLENNPPLPLLKKDRLLSLDALRGFDMLMISGAADFLLSMKSKTHLAWVNVIAEQMEHPAWNGFAFYDFIFPLFLFIAGVSLSYSVTKGMRIGVTRKHIYKKAFIRMLILMCLGIFYKNTPIKFFEPSQIRFVSVLGRIGFACFISTLLFINFSSIRRVGWVAGILLAYYAAIFLIPVPGFGAGDLSIEGNLTGWFDRNFLPGRLHQGIYDENGILTQFPALCLTLMGTVAGDILRSDKGDYKKLLFLSSAGVGALCIGFIWSLHFPVNKHLWSSSFIMLTGGIAFLSLGFFYWIIDILKLKRWTFFLKVIGLNSLTIYLAYHFIDFNHTSEMLFSGLYAPVPEPWHVVFQGLGALILVWLFLYVLYKKKWFLKI